MEELNRNLHTRDFKIIEVAGDFIKNPTEQEKTELPLHAMLLKKEQKRQKFFTQKNRLANL